MGWLGRLWSSEPTAPANRDPADDFWFDDAPQGGLDAGEVVTPMRALQIPAVIDALDAISQPLAHLPLKVFRRTGPGEEDKEPAPNHPASRLLADPSSGDMTRYEFRGQKQWDTALHANSYAEWVFGDGGAEGWRLHSADLVRVDRQAGETIYWVNDTDTGRLRRVPADLMWHTRSLPLDRDRLCGISPVALNSQTLSRALAVQAYGARFFKNDGQAGGTMEHPAHFKSSEDRDKFMAGWRKARTGRNAHRDALLEFGIKYNRQSLDNQKSQFLETEQYMAIQCARIWHVPPYKIRSLEHGIKANVEQQSIDFVTDALLGWLVLEETSINRHVIRPLNEAGGLEDEYFAEFNAAGLLRGDLKSRYEAFGLARNWGWLSVNEIRRMENLPPIAGGNTYLQPLNMQPAGTQPPADPPPDTAPEPPPETLPDSGDD